MRSGAADLQQRIVADIGLLKELGADAVRTAHYPQSDRVYSLCDKEGLLAWCETPCVNGLVFTPEFKDEVWRETREMVDQLGNHPSIFCWSIFNELYNKVEMEEGAPESVMEELRDYVRSLDPSRPVGPGWPRRRCWLAPLTNVLRSRSPVRPVREAFP